MLRTSDQTAQHVAPTFAHCELGLIPGRLVAREGKYPSSFDWHNVPDVFIRRLQNRAARIEGHIGGVRDDVRPEEPQIAAQQVLAAVQPVAALNAVGR